MAIQMRRGKFTEFLPSKLMPGEWAIVQGDDPDASDGKSVYVAFAAGVVKRMATYADMVDSCKTAIAEAIDVISSDTAKQLTAKVEATDKSVSDAEASRVAAEKSRVSAESSRASAESSRAAAENKRASAESARVAAESKRASAEQGRVSAEAGRVSAEEDRADEFEDVISKAEKVNASVSGTTISVTDRNGAVSSVDVADAVSGTVSDLRAADAANSAAIAKAERSIVDAVGLDSYVLPVGDRLASGGVSGNTVTILGGTICLQGKRTALEGSRAVAVDAGASGKYRRDIIGVTYTAATGKFAFTVVRGTPASSESAAADPDYDEGDLLAGDAQAFMPLYRVKLSGTSVGDPEPLFSVLTHLADVAALDRGGVGIAPSSFGSSISGWYIQAIESGASRSVYVGGNVSPSSTVSANATLCRITTTREFSDRGTLLFRGAFTKHQSGLYVTWGDDGHTLTLICEQGTSFAQQDTMSVTIPCTWVP